MRRSYDPHSGLATLEWMLREGQRVQACHRHLARPWPEWAERYLESHFINLNLARWSESICVTQLDILFLMQKALRILFIQGLVSLLAFKVELLIKSLFCPGYSLQLAKFLEVFRGNFLVWSQLQSWPKLGEILGEKCEAVRLLLSHLATYQGKSEECVWQTQFFLVEVCLHGILSVIFRGIYSCRYQ